MNIHRKLTMLKKEHREISEEIDKARACLEIRECLCPDLVQRKMTLVRDLTAIQEPLEERIYELMSIKIL